MTLTWDCLHRFLFEHRGVRGVMVHLDAAIRRNVSAHDYPAPVANLVAEAVTAVALLITTVKLQGRLSLQLQGAGAVPLLVAECTHDGGLRAVARWQDVPDGAVFADLVRGGTLALNLVPDDGHPYQGIVPLDGASLADCLATYFRQSEQLATHLQLLHDGQRGVGLLLQALPGENAEDAWSHLSILAATLKPEEAFALPVETVLHRLYHEEEVRLFDTQPLRFQCRCSRERSADSLRLLSADDLAHAIAEQGTLTVTCDFCNEHYRFDAVDVAALAHSAAPPAGEQRH